MKTAVSLSAFLILFSLNSWAQESDYAKRNTHIFCSSHLAIVSESLDEEAGQQRALSSLARMHRDAGRAQGATKQHFEDVAGYLKKIRSDDEAKWNILSAQSREVCFPRSE